MVSWRAEVRGESVVLAGVGVAAVQLWFEVAVVPAGVGVPAVFAGSAAGRDGNWGRGEGPAAARGGRVLLPEEGEEPAPEKGAVCRSQQECTCPPGPSGAPWPVISATNRGDRPAGSIRRRRRRRSACAQ